MKKANTMKPKTTHLEILLFAGTSFTRREFCQKGEEKETGKKASPIDELEKACWSGLLFELLPELANCHSIGKESFIWHILNGKNFLYISMGPYPEAADNETSIDPYLFMMSMCES